MTSSHHVCPLSRNTFLASIPKLCRREIFTPGSAEYMHSASSPNFIVSIRLTLEEHSRGIYVTTDTEKTARMRATLAINYCLLTLAHTHTCIMLHTWGKTSKIYTMVHKILKSHILNNMSQCTQDKMVSTGYVVQCKQGPVNTGYRYNNKPTKQK